MQERERMVAIYVKRILNKKMTLQEVPKKWREQVKEILENNTISS